MTTYTINASGSQTYTFTDTNDSLLYHKKVERNVLLTQSDMFVVPDRGLSDSKLTAWKTYRQELRDLDFSDPLNIVWPEEPK